MCSGVEGGCLVVEREGGREESGKEEDRIRRMGNREGAGEREMETEKEKWKEIKVVRVEEVKKIVERRDFGL
jgi:hypothetical protein